MSAIAERESSSRKDRYVASWDAARTRNRVAGTRIRSAPTLTSAIFVRPSRPHSESRKSAYGNPHGRSGSVASSTPMPGTITTFCRRTHHAVRKTSMIFPRPLVTIDRSPEACRYSPLYQFSRTAGIP